MADWPRNHSNMRVKVGIAHRGEREQPEVADAMDWLMDDEMMRHWEDVSKEEEEISVKRSEGGSRK